MLISGSIQVGLATPDRILYLGTPRLGVFSDMP